MSHIVIVGASGHGKVVADAALGSGHSVVGFLDRDESKKSWCDLPVLGDEEQVEDILRDAPDTKVVVAIGDNAIRARVVARLRDRYSGLVFETVIHSAAVVGRHVTIGPGTVVLGGAVLNPSSSIGSHCIVNTGALVDHDCSIGDFSTVGPGACLGGNVSLGRGSVVGLGAAVIHGVSIGKHTVLGAGSLALESLPPGVVAFGTPAQTIRSRSEDDPYL